MSEVRKLHERKKRVDEIRKNKAREHLGVGVAVQKHLLGAVIAINSRIVVCSASHWSC